MTEFEFGRYYDSFFVAAYKKCASGEEDEVINAVIKGIYELFSDEAADGRLRLLKEHFTEGELYLEIKPFDFSFERVRGMFEAVEAIVYALEDGCPKAVTVG